MHLPPKMNIAQFSLFLHTSQSKKREQKKPVQRLLWTGWCTPVTLLHRVAPAAPPCHAAHHCLCSTVLAAHHWLCCSESTTTLHCQSPQQSQAKENTLQTNTSKYDKSNRKQRPTQTFKHQMSQVHHHHKQKRHQVRDKWIQSMQTNVLKIDFLGDCVGWKKDD